MRLNPSVLNHKIGLNVVFAVKFMVILRECVCAHTLACTHTHQALVHWLPIIFVLLLNHSQIQLASMDWACCASPGISIWYLPPFNTTWVWVLWLHAHVTQTFGDWGRRIQSLKPPWAKNETLPQTNNEKSTCRTIRKLIFGGALVSEPRGSHRCLGQVRHGRCSLCVISREISLCSSQIKTL